MNQTTVKSKKQKSWGDKLRNWVETIGTIPNRLTKKRKPNRLHECFSRDEVSCLREAVPNYYTTRLASDIRQWKFMGFEPNPDLTNCDYPARCLTENSQDSTSKATSFALIITPIAAIFLFVLWRCCKRRQANLNPNEQPLMKDLQHIDYEGGLSTTASRDYQTTHLSSDDLNRDPAGGVYATLDDAHGRDMLNGENGQSNTNPVHRSITPKKDDSGRINEFLRDSGEPHSDTESESSSRRSSPEHRVRAGGETWS